MFGTASPEVPDSPPIISSRVARVSDWTPRPTPTKAPTATVQQPTAGTILVATPICVYFASIDHVFPYLDRGSWFRKCRKFRLAETDPAHPDPAPDAVASFPARRGRGAAYGASATWGGREGPPATSTLLGPASPPQTPSRIPSRESVASMTEGGTSLGPAHSDNTTPPPRGEAAVHGTSSSPAMEAARWLQEREAGLLAQAGRRRGGT